MPKTKPTTVTAYINAAPKHARAKLREIRAVLTYSAFKSHLIFFPTHPAMVPFQQELAK